MATPTVQPVRRRTVPWSRTVHSEVRGEVFGVSANRVLVLDPSRRRTTVQRGRPSPPYLADLLTVPRAALRQACRLSDLPAELTRCGQVPRMPKVADQRCVISETPSLAEHGAAGAVADQTFGHLSALLADAPSDLGASLTAPTGCPVSGGAAQGRAVDRTDACGPCRAGGHHCDLSQAELQPQIVAAGVWGMRSSRAAQLLGAGPPVSCPCRSAVRADECDLTRRRGGRCPLSSLFPTVPSQVRSVPGTDIDAPLTKGAWGRRSTGRFA